MLLKTEQSCLLLVDVQEKLAPKVLAPEKLIANCRWLLQLAQRLNVPTLVSEQYPKGLGHTVAELRELVATDLFIDKVHFSCASDAQCLQKINALQRPQIVMMGIETHVCMLQTALELKQQGKEVYVVADACSARHELDHQMGIQRMRAAGVHIVTKEMVFFEWVHCAGTETFKQLSKEFLR